VTAANDTGAIPATAPAKVPVGVKFAYSFGQVIETGYYTVSGFIFFYYTAVLGLSGALVGAAMAISLCLDAILDPFIGSLSDNVRSKYGRRLPVMLLGAPLTALSLGLLFQPPADLSPFLLFGWLTLTKMALRAFASVYNLPYGALGAEMTQDYVDRSSVVAWRTVVGTLAGLVITAVAFSVFFAGEGGLQQADRYPGFGWMSAGVLLVAGLIACAGSWRFAAALPQPTAPAESLAQGLLSGLGEVFRNSSFRSLFFSALMFWVAAGINGALNNHAYTFVWRLRPEHIQVVTYAYFAGIFGGVVLSPLLLRRIEKRTAVLLSLAILLVGWCTVQFARMSGGFAPTGAEALPFLAANGALLGVGVGMVAIAYPSMMADAAEEHELLFGRRREALYFAGLGFSSKAAAGLGQLVGGVAISLMAFPKEAGHQVGVDLGEPLLKSLTFAWGPLAAIFGLLGMLALLPYGITRARHAVMTEQLAAKRAAELSEAHSS
jgi:GPH family glycoside/pentoside/hexuronide:cation symporter